MLAEFARGTTSSHQRVLPKDILASEVADMRMPKEEAKAIRDLLIKKLIKQDK